MEKGHDLQSIREQIGVQTGMVLYLYSDDCPPCVSLRPKVQELMETQFPKMKLILADSKANPEIPASFGVFANPAILVFFDGKEFRRFSKYISIPELQATIQRYYSLAF